MRLIDRISGRIEKVIYPKKARNVRLTRPVYKDRHSGRNFLIIALGPNTAKYKEEIFDFVRNDNFVTVGVNNCFDLDINFDYHAITSRHRFADYGKRLNETSSTPMIAPYIQKGPLEKFLTKRG